MYAHLLQFINPRSFSILKSTDMLVMVYLGGVGSLTGSLLGATIFTVLLELLRPLGIWRWVVGPLMLVLLMIYRPQGLMGFKEARLFKPELPRRPDGPGASPCEPGTGNVVRIAPHCPRSQVALGNEFGDQVVTYGYELLSGAFLQAQLGNR